MIGENSLPPWARQILIGIGLFLAGAILSFGYSYRPLHGAMVWRVDQLESRLDERNRENLRLSDELASRRSDDATRIDPDTLAQVERELDQTQRVLYQAEKDLKRAERKRKDSIAGATKWRKRFEELRDTPAPLAATTPATLEDHAGGTANVETAPAAPGLPPSDSSASTSSERSQATVERGILSSKETAGPATP